MFADELIVRIALVLEFQHLLEGEFTMASVAVFLRELPFEKMDIVLGVASRAFGDLQACRLQGGFDASRTPMSSAFGIGRCVVQGCGLARLQAVMVQ